MTAQPQTIAHLYNRQAERLRHKVAMHQRRGEGWAPTTWQQANDTVMALARGLWQLGCRKGDRVAILAETRQEWLLCDLAALSFGGVTVGIYPTSTADQVAYVLRHSGAKAIFVENAAQLEKLGEALAPGRLVDLQHLVLIDGASPDPTTSKAWGERTLLRFDELRAQGRGALAQEPRWARRVRDAVGPDDLATLIYTSGTTSPPKGVELTHANLHSIALTTRDWMSVSENDTAVIFLPLAHSLQRVATYAGLAAGVSAHFVADPTQLMETFQLAQPSIAASVPRVFEKVHAKIVGQVAQASPRRQRLFATALRVGRARSRRQQRNESVPLALAAANALFDRLVFSKLRAKTFGSNVRFIISGGAPIAVELLEFFHAMGILIVEGYGLTETSAPITLNRPEELVFGSVGRPLPGSDVRIGADQEIELRGTGVFRGYYRDAEATAEAFTHDGWFRSGDIGHLDRDGFLHITDRQKDIIITAGGKNIAPQNIENVLKQAPLISQAMVHGDRRRYLVALLTLDDEELVTWARGEGLEGLSRAALCRHPRLEERVATLVEEANAALPRYETIKRYRILEDDFSVDDDTLTPTMKVKRRAVEKRYEALLAELYR